MKDKAELLLHCLRCDHLPILHREDSNKIIEDGEVLYEISNVHHECPKCGAKQGWKQPDYKERILLSKFENLKEIKEFAYNEEDPEVAIEKAIMNTCCLIREKMYHIIDGFPDEKSAQSFFQILGINEGVGVVLELEKEAKFKTQSWRASK